MVDGLHNVDFAVFRDIVPADSADRPREASSVATRSPVVSLWCCQQLCGDIGSVICRGSSLMRMFYAACFQEFQRCYREEFPRMLQPSLQDSHGRCVRRVPLLLHLAGQVFGSVRMLRKRVQVARLGFNVFPARGCVAFCNIHTVRLRRAVVH